MKGDATLFMRADQAETDQRVLMPVLEVWAEVPPVIFPITPPAHGDRRTFRVCSGKDTAGLCRLTWRGIVRRKRKIRDSAQHSVGQDFGDSHWFGLLLVSDLRAPYLDAGEQLLSSRIQKPAASAVLVHGRRERPNALGQCAAP